MALVEDMFRRFMSRQARFFDRLPEGAKQKLADVENKYAELRVTGPEGGVLYFQYKGQRLQMLDQAPAVSYEKLDKFLVDGDLLNYPSGDEVLLDVIDGSLSPRAALSRKYFRANTDKIIYDSEEFAQAFEQFLDEMRMVLGGRSAG
ncbi:unnamed protein product [marine sediment metagenome]|uniref:SCP2 domain-containing protein n=1 Tax=marine sediment metagenome TaxID=412755 RepID=X1T8C3_9ZZZZ